MNPFVVRVGDTYRLYYAGGDREGHRRICLATSPVDSPQELHRQGAVLELGAPGSYDSAWCVLPWVLTAGERSYLYYTGKDDTDRGLQSFRGIGMAVSKDGLHFTRASTEPAVTGNRTARFPKNGGIAGGSILSEPDEGDRGASRYRMYYTLSVGVPSEDIAVSQEKHCAVCVSADGVSWKDHRIVMSPRPGAPHEDIAVATPHVWRVDGGYRMLYSGIGTKWRNYSILEAASSDGYTWFRGGPAENCSLEPIPGSAWESASVEYPCVVPEGGSLRLYYCGDRYGGTGIGTATTPLRSD